MATNIWIFLLGIYGAIILSENAIDNNELLFTKAEVAGSGYLLMPEVAR